MDISGGKCVHGSMKACKGSDQPNQELQEKLHGIIGKVIKYKKRKNFQVESERQKWRQWCGQHL